MTDLPSGTYAAPTDASGNPLTYQIDQVGPAWPDGSMRHCVYNVLVPVTSGGGNTRIELNKITGTYSPASTPRSTADFSTAHNFQVHYKNVMTNPASGWAIKGPTGTNQGNFTFSLNSAISAGRYQTIKNGPVSLEIYAYGLMTSDVDGSTDPHLWVEYWISSYTDPTDPTGPPLYYKHMVKIGQPLITPTDTGVDAVIGAASLYDGATKLRDYADDAVTLGPSDVVLSGSPAYFNGSNTPYPLQAGAWYQVNLNAGSTLPTGMTNGMFVSAQSGRDVASTLQLYSTAIAALAGTLVVPTTTGSGPAHASMTLTPLQYCPYYNGFYVCGAGPGDGDPILSPGTWRLPVRFLPNLDGTTNDSSSASQKAYWISSGLVPPWNLSLGPDCLPVIPNYSFEDAGGGPSGPGYFPASNGPQRPNIQGGGAGLTTDGPWAEWDARWFIRMGTSGWRTDDHQLSWVSGLVNATLPTTHMLRWPGGANPAYVVPWDNGPDNAGSSYPALGIPAPIDQWYQPNAVTGTNVVNSGSNWVIPPHTAVNGADGIWGFGLWGNSAGQNYHWPQFGMLAYMFFGERFMLEEIRRSGNKCIFQYYSDTPRAPVTIGGTRYYAPIEIAAAQGETLMILAAASIFGNASDPEVAYFQNVLTNNLGLRNARFGPGGNAGAAAIAAGWSAVDNVTFGFNAAYDAVGHAWITKATRSPIAANYLNMWATFFSGFYDSASVPGVGSWGIGIVYGGGSYRTNCGGSNYSGGFINNPKTYMGTTEMPLGSPVTFQSDGTVQYGGSFLQYLGLNQGDVMYTTNSVASPQLPSEFFSSNFPDGQPFYVCQLNTTAQTFKLTPVAGDPTGVHAISSITSVITPYTPVAESDNFNWRPTVDNGDVWGNDGTLDCYGQIPRAILAECVHAGAVANPTWGVNLAIADSVATSRVAVTPGATTTVTDTSVARLCQVSSAVPLYPPL